jgi:uncharacterized UBP type Zn finger protein
LPGEPISAHVNSLFTDEIEGLGFSKDVAEKALFLTSNMGVEPALKWLEDNKNAPDFNEPLYITSGPKSTLTNEEARLKGLEL